MSRSAGRNFGSCSVALPRNRRSSSAALCHRGGAVGSCGGAVGCRGGAAGSRGSAVGSCGGDAVGSRGSAMGSRGSGAVGSCGGGAVGCRGGAVGSRGLGCSGSRSLDGSVRSSPAGAAGRSSPRCGSGFGAAGTGPGCRGTGFGYRAGGASRPRTVTPITINEQLLQPLCLELDANVQAVKHQEKEQIKTLNNKFASFIDKVRLLEQQNKVLETKWSFLQGQTPPGSSVVPVLQAFIGHLKKQLEALGCDRAQLETDLKAAQQVLEHNKKMYKDERSQRPRAQSRFSALKKDADCFFLNKAELEAKLESLREEVEFLRTLYGEETQQLRANIAETSVVVQTDNSRDLDLGGIAADVRAQYEDIARRSRAEAQAWYESKFEELRVTVGRNTTSLQETTTKIAELARRVWTLSRDLRAAKDQCCRLQDAVADAEQRGETAVEGAKHKLSGLQTALRRSTAELARRLREHQQLSSVRLGLDIEIVTYKKLLEGEESRLCAEGGFPISVPVCCSQGGLTHPEPGFASTHVSPSEPRAEHRGHGGELRGRGAAGAPGAPSGRCRP